MDREALKPICLITPPSTFLLDERTFVSLGILRVAAVLELAGYAVEHLDLCGITNFEEAMRAHAAGSEAEVFGITATTPQMPATNKIAKAIRAVRPNARIILGGPHVTLVAAARKLEKKQGVESRAHRAFDALTGSFDVLVGGDGEESIFSALQTTGNYIDADDPHGGLFLTNASYEALPFPARHLVDMDSYHYSIDGVRATSMIAQLGCLAPGTLIRLASNAQVPIEEIKVGDSVVSWDEEEECISSGPVVNISERIAEDIWELHTEFDTIRVTSEHPVWTPSGWKKVVDLQPGKDRIAYLHAVQAQVHGEEKPAQQGSVLQRQVSEGPARKAMSQLSQEIRIDEMPSARVELVLVSLPWRMAENERQSEMVACGPSGNARQVGSDVAQREVGKLKYQGAPQERKDETRPANLLRNQARGLESHEARRSVREGIANSQGEMESHSCEAHEEALGRWDLETAMGMARVESRPELFGASAVGHSLGHRPRISIRGERGVLDRTMRIREEKESRLHRPQGEEGDLDARGVLAFDQGGHAGAEGLPIEGMGRADCLDARTEAQEPEKIAFQDREVRFAKVIGKKWIGAGKVHNFTVCPGHSYIANGIVVHNCPFACAFCGGRESAMLRRIRTRSTESIVEEVALLNETYGFGGIMLYDDELNVNRQMVQLMNAIADLGENRGVDFRLRGFIKSELFDDEQAMAMRRAGFRWILVGFESGSPRILENINKKATRDQNTRCLRIARDHGLKVKALMSIGHAGESAETVADTKQWLLDEKPDDFDCTIISCYPGTPYYDHATQTASDVYTFTAPKSGDQLHAFDVDYATVEDNYKGMPGEYHSFVFTDSLSPDDLVRLRDDLESEVREKLGIPFNAGAPGIRYEAAMGMMPGHILRRSGAKQPA